MTLFMFIISKIDLKYNVFESQDYMLYDCNDKRCIIYNNGYKYPWINLSKNHTDFENSKRIYLKFWPNFNKRSYPDPDLVIDKLFKCNQYSRRLHVNKPNLFFSWTANYFTQFFLHTTYRNDYLPLTVHEIFPRPTYGASIEEENIIRSFSNGTVKMHTDHTPLRLSDISESQQKSVYNLNPNNQNIFISGIDRGNVSVGHYIFQTILLRNHNKLCTQIIELVPDLNDEQIYQTAKTINLYQFIKIIIGPYVSAISGDIVNIKSDYYSSNEFTNRSISFTWEYNVIYQWHSMLPEMVNDQKLSSLMYKPEEFYKKNIGEWIKEGLGTQLYEQRLNNSLDFLLPVEKKVLLASRRANVSSYCEYRRKLKLQVPKTFIELTGGDLTMAKNLEDVYKNVEDVEFYVGVLAEPIYKSIIANKSFFGETISKMLSMIALNILPVEIKTLREYITNVDEKLLPLVDNLDLFLANLTEEEKMSLGEIDISFNVQLNNPKLNN